MLTASIIGMLPRVRDADRNTDWWLSDKYYPWYFNIAKERRPGRILEIGAGFGYSLAAMFRGSGVVNQIVAVDDESWWPGSQRMAGENLRALDYKGMLDLRKRSCAEFIRENAPVRFDMVHVDACYSDILSLWTFVAPYGTMIVDDTLHEACVSWHVEAARPKMLNLAEDRYLPSFRGWWVGKRGPA
jgi:predicted O-methyltransferase YrrM